MVKVYLNAGFGEPVGADDLSLARSLGFSGVRQDVLFPQDAALLVQDLAGADLSPLFIIPYQSAGVAETVIREAERVFDVDGYALELGNEVNLIADPFNYARWFAYTEKCCREISSEVELVTAGVSTTSKRAMKWLASALSGASRSCIVGYHTYRQNAKPNPNASQEGYSSRGAEFAALRSVANGRRLWNTEIGWHTAPRSKGWWIFKRTWSLSDAEAADHLLKEIELNSAAGAEVLTVYQLNDGPDAKRDQDRYGIRTADGTLKPQAHVVAASRTA